MFLKDRRLADFLMASSDLTCLYLLHHMGSHSLFARFFSTMHEDNILYCQGLVSIIQKNEAVLSKLKISRSSISERKIGSFSLHIAAPSVRATLPSSIFCKRYYDEDMPGQKKTYCKQLIEEIIHCCINVALFA